MSKVVIKAHKLGKSYRVPYLPEDNEGSLDAIGKKLSYRTFWALRDVSFQIYEGEIVGIIGSNGAGKTTLLKILSRVAHPSEGWAEVDGRLGSLLQVGAGFHADLSGRENVYMNGAILGMSRSNISQKFDEIVEFAEVGRFIDFPIKHYSSGMAARLAFSVAAHLETEILILDEALSVGDASFQKKSQEKMRSVIKDGKTVLIVSHNLSVLPDLCTRAFYMAEGQLMYEGGLDETIDRYLGISGGTVYSFKETPVPEFVVDIGATVEAADKSPKGWIEQQQYRNYQGVRTLTFLQLSMSGSDGVARRRFHDDEAVQVRLTFQCHAAMQFRCIFCIYSVNGEAILVSSNEDVGPMFCSLEEGTHETQVKIPAELLWPRNYVMEIALINQGVERLTLKRTLEFVIQPRSKKAIGLPAAWIRYPLNWTLPAPVNPDPIQSA